MPEYGGKFYDFIQVQDKIYSERRPVQHKCGNASKRDCDAPKRDGIADQAEARVAACAEDASDGGRVYGLSDQVIGADEKHPFQISFRFPVERCKAENKRREQ